MSKHAARRPSLLASTLLLLVLLVAHAPVTSAQQALTYDWFGWGVNVNFQQSTWKVRYVTYLGSNTAPHVREEIVEDISADCVEVGGKLSYPTAGSAYFDGSVYLKCALPSTREKLLELGFTPPGDGSFCICQLGNAPFWVDGQVRQLNTVGTMPFLDAGDRGVRVNLLVNATTARTRLEVARPLPAGPLLYTSPAWPVDAAGNRTLVGWYGKGIVAVADYFNALNYLTNPDWRTFLQTQVTGPMIGSWHESSATTISGTRQLTGTHRMGLNAGFLYVGYSPATGQYLTGEVDRGGIDPGCPGL